MLEGTAIEDGQQLSVCAYIDLNPVAAGIAAVPEESSHTSVKARVEHEKDQGRVPDHLGHLHCDRRRCSWRHATSLRIPFGHSA